MRESRLVADMSLPEAAAALRLGEIGQLTDIESGASLPSFESAIRAAEVYGTTIDYLGGLTEDGDRDSSAALQRYVASRLTAELQRLTRGTIAAHVETIRALHPTAAEGRRVAREVIAVARSLAKLREMNPEFNSELRGGASLVARMGRAAVCASDYLAKLERGRQANAVLGSCVDAGDQALAEGGVELFKEVSEERST